MGLTGFELARRLAQANVDYEAAQNLIRQVSAAPELQPPKADKPAVVIPHALALINSTDSAAAEKLVPLPGIGPAAARKLLERRPEGGYASLEQAAELNPELAERPFNVKWDAIASWQPKGMHDG
ncbi:hypothetical protein [Pseudanabaena sp. FACHB-2040]|uniref:hypothetical protein n=1 Tax=Pseudanabaena sp. FACHB-2040 TaxID=2692859 RepID=UPI0016895451|nr:hypothetical protein [Pseudanabaena sp. FACHB-2040]MBD2261360.1 hypothetical protein [Pseudanabaena sp. FACHB-2040]